MKLSETIASTVAINVIQAAVESLPGGADAIIAALEIAQATLASELSNPSTPQAGE